MTKALQRIMTLENELKILDSHIRGLEKDWDQEVHSLENELKKSDNRILDLEHELYIEKTRGTKHKFFWFTAKKTPLITDVSYLSNENTLYGFKQPPNYHFIEHHDLRFITHCSLDDLIEQFG